MSEPDVCPAAETRDQAAPAGRAVPDDQPGLSGGLVRLMAVTCAVTVANLYYAQPLVGPISASIGLAPGASGLIVTLTQVGYALGLLLIVPLADLIENRRLVVTALLVTLGALLAAALATDRGLFLPAAFVIGLSCVAAQVLVPYAAHFTAEAHRGRAVGTVMTGLLLGIMLSRPTASVIAGVWSWHAVYFASAVALAVLIAVLARKLPQRRPSASMGYLALLGSMGNLLLTTAILRRRALYHALMFGAFSVFWTTAPLLLAGPAFRVSQTGIALFALVGVAGAIAAPIAGQLADRGWTRPATAVAMLLVLGGFALSRTAIHGTHAELLLLGACGILIDLGVAANLVLGQRAIFVLGAEYRSRLNGLYMATFFLGGAVGSSLGAWSYFTHGWSTAVLLGAAAPTLGLLCFATELGRKAVR